MPSLRPFWTHENTLFEFEFLKVIEFQAQYETTKDFIIINGTEYIVSVNV